MDYNISIPDIYSKSYKKEIPLLKTIEIFFHTKDEYDIIINDEKCNYLKNKNTEKNIIINFSDIEKHYRTHMSKIIPIFNVKTNCNILLYHEINIGMDIEYYHLFDGYTNQLKYGAFFSDEYTLYKYTNTLYKYTNNLCTKYNKTNEFYESVHNKYVKLYFYYYDNNIFNQFYNDYCSLEYIEYGYKYNRNDTYYVDFLKYFTIDGFILNNDIDYINDKIDNSIINIKLLYNGKNTLDIVCVMNILETGKTFMLIFTPIKIIDNNNYCQINIFDNTCNECVFNKHKQLDKYYSKLLFMCKKHYTNLEKKIISLFEEDEIYYIIDHDNLLLILKEKYNLYNLKKTPKIYRME